VVNLIDIIETLCKIEYFYSLQGSAAIEVMWGGKYLYSI